MYARSGFDMITPAVKNILLSTVAVFMFQELIAYNLNDLLIWFLPEAYQQQFRFYNPPISAFEYIFGLVPHLVIGKFYLWQLGSYMFLHGGFWHIFINMFILWMFGCELERTWGSKEFLKYYLLTGTIAGVTIFLWNMFMGNPNTPTIGASGAVFGILAAYALFFPDREIYVYFLFPVKAKYFVLFIGLIEFLSLPSQDGVSHIGHLGGLVAGFFYLRHHYAHWGIGQNFFRNFFKKKDLF